MNRTRDFYILMMGRFVSGSGSFFNMVALNLFIFMKTGSATVTGLAMATRILTASLVSPYLGNLADRMDRRLGMIISDAFLGVTMLALALTPHDSGIIIPILFVVQVALGIFQNFFMINFQAALPNFAPKGDIVFANSIFQIVSSATFVAGAMGAAAAIHLIGYSWAFAIDGFSYLISLGILVALPIATQELRAEKKREIKEGFVNGINFLIKTSPFVFLAFVIRWLDGVGSGSHNVSLPVFSESLLPETPNRIYGLVFAFWGAGGIIGALLMNRKSFVERSNLSRLFMISTLLMSAFWVCTFQTSALLTILAFAVIAGIFDTIATVSYSVILQKTEDAVRGRVMALSTVALTTGFGGGMALSSMMASNFFTPARLVAFWHGIPIVFIVMSLIVGLFSVKVKTFLSSAPECGN